MTNAEKRTLLRRYMATCPACCAEQADEVADKDLDRWLESHGWPKSPPERLNAEEQAEFDEAEAEARAAAGGRTEGR